MSNVSNLSDMKQTHSIVTRVFIILISISCANCDFARGVKPVAGGHPANTEKWKFLATLQFSNGKFCLGTIINKRNILTAAECMSDANSVTGKIGVYELTSNEGKTFTSSKFLVHPGYTAKTGKVCVISKNNVGLIKLNEDILPGEMIKYVSLSSDEISESESCETVGWSSQYFANHSGNFPELSLIEFEQNVISSKNCEKDCGNKVEVLNICTKFEKQLAQPSLNIPGGPLICNGEQKGLLTWGQKGTETAFPIIWENIVPHESWITKKHERNEEDRFVRAESVAAAAGKEAGDSPGAAILSSRSSSTNTSPMHWIYLIIAQMLTICKLLYF